MPEAHTPLFEYWRQIRPFGEPDQWSGLIGPRMAPRHKDRITRATKCAKAELLEEAGKSRAGSMEGTTLAGQQRSAPEATCRDEPWRRAMDGDGPPRMRIYDAEP
jgi:hypothetical protein